MLVLTRRVGEKIIIGRGEDQIVIRINEMIGNQIKIAIDAPKHISVDREEIYKSKLKNNEKNLERSS